MLAHPLALFTPLRQWRSPSPDSALAAERRRGRSGTALLVHVLWSMWVFITPLFYGGHDARWVRLTLLSFPLFLLLYIGVITAPRRTALGYALAMVALCLVLMPWYPEGLSYFVFGCILLRTSAPRPLWRYVLELLALNAVLVGVALALGYPWQMIAWMPAMTLIVGLIVAVEQRNAEMDAALRLSHEEVRRLAAVAERERIGRDLHDLLGHTLSLVALKSDLAGKLLQRDPQAARREVDEVSAVAREALSQVRAAVTGIRATGIAAELASARLLLECDGVILQYTVDDRCLDGRGALPPALETALAMTLREAVTNIQRHAHARQAEVAFELRDGEAVLSIADDGRGGAIVPGNGLSGMRERIEALGGRLRVDSAPAGGTRIEARVPLAVAIDAPARGAAA